MILRSGSTGARWKNFVMNHRAKNGITSLSTLQLHRQPMVAPNLSFRAPRFPKQSQNQWPNRRLTSVSLHTKRRTCQPCPHLQQLRLRLQQRSQLNHQQQTPSSTRPTDPNNHPLTPANQAPPPSTALSPSWTTPLLPPADPQAPLAQALTSHPQRVACRSRVLRRGMWLTGNYRSSQRRVGFRSRAVVRQMRVRRRLRLRLWVGGVD